MPEKTKEQIKAEYEKTKSDIAKLWNTHTSAKEIQKLSHDLEIAYANELKKYGYTNKQQIDPFIRFLLNKTVSLFFSGEDKALTKGTLQLHYTGNYLCVNEWVIGVNEISRIASDASDTEHSIYLF